MKQFILLIFQFLFCSAFSQIHGQNANVDKMRSILMSHSWRLIGSIGDRFDVKTSETYFFVFEEDNSLKIYNNRKLVWQTRYSVHEIDEFYTGVKIYNVYPCLEIFVLSSNKKKNAYECIDFQILYYPTSRQKRLQLKEYGKPVQQTQCISNFD